MAECTIYDKLRYILETKDLIKAALISQDVEVLDSDTFRKYAQYVTEIRKVSSVNGLQGDVTLKTINGEQITGEGDIKVQGEVDLTNYYTKEEVNDLIPDISDLIIEETDPIFDKWKSSETIIAGNGATYDIDGASEEDMHPSVVIGKDAMVWADGIAIGENAYSEMGAVVIGKNVTSYGLVSIGSDNNGNGIAIGKNNKGSGISIGEDNNNGGIAIGNSITENYGGIAIGDNISNITDNGIAIGRNAKINTQFPEDTDNGEGIAIGLDAIAYSKDDVVIGSNVMTDFSFKTNINDIIKGDSNKYAYIKDENGIYTKILDLINNGSSEGGSVKVVELTQAEYDALETKEEGVIYVITDADEIAIPTKLSELENDKGYITEIPSEYITDTELNTTIAPLILNVTQGVNRLNIERYDKVKHSIYYRTINGEQILGEGDISFKTINGESIIGDGNIEIEGGMGTITIKELTQAEYDALTSYDDDTFYVITDADKQYVIQSDLSNYYTKSEIDSLIGNVSSKITEINNLI